MKLGHGGDSVQAEFLGLDPHTIARGRRQLLDQDVEVGRIRQSSAGRKPVEKKPEVIEAIEILRCALQNTKMCPLSGSHDSRSRTKP
jgi:hypothetical protein